jgi:hypothetical protein
MQAGSAVPEKSADDIFPQRGPRVTPVSTQFPRLPDFSKTGGIDLIRDVVYVDSMEFSISKTDADQFRLYCIQIAHAFITVKLNEAVSSLSAAVAAATPEAMSGGD